MLLAIDIGNTNLSFGIFLGRQLKAQFDIPAQIYSRSKLLKKLKSNPGISAAVICSVVPRLTKVLRQDLKTLIGNPTYIIGKSLTVPLKSYYNQPSQLGQDRLVNAYAAQKLYPAPLIVIDSGTAITLDVVDKNKAYRGGLIIPGIEISLEALREKTAQLPLVKLSKPKMLIGRDTKNSIISGVVFGIAGSTKWLITKLKQSLGKHTRVIGTGGNICLIKKYSGIKIEIDPDLTLKGINLIYENNL